MDYFAETRRHRTKLERWVLRKAWRIAYRAYNWLEDRRPAGGF